MSISIVRPWRPEPLQVRESALLRDAIAAHETKMNATADTRALVLTRQVMEILKRPVDRIAYLPRPHREPVAIVDGVQLRWIPERYDRLEPGWLMVRTDADGWVQVDSLEQLGAHAKRYGLALVPAS